MFDYPAGFEAPDRGGAGDEFLPRRRHQYNAGPASDSIREACDDRGFEMAVYGVQKQDWRCAQERSGKHHGLLLSKRELHPTARQHVIQPAR